MVRFKLNHHLPLLKKLLDVCGFQDVRMLGGKFTWTGKRHTHSIKSKIDRAVATCDWHEMCIPQLIFSFYLGKVQTIDHCFYTQNLLSGKDTNRSNMTIDGDSMLVLKKQLGIHGQRIAKVFQQLISVMLIKTVEKHYQNGSLKISQTPKRKFGNSRNHRSLHKAYDSYSLDYNHIRNLPSFAESIGWKKSIGKLEATFIGCKQVIKIPNTSMLNQSNEDLTIASLQSQMTQGSFCLKIVKLRQFFMIIFTIFTPQTAGIT